MIQVVSDFPEMPRLVRVLDGIPRERRVVVDLWGHFNDTIRLEHDFNHLEKLDGHLGWEWEEAIAAVSDTILQPTLSPLRPGVGSFLFHGFDAGAVVKPYETAADAAAAWRDSKRPYGVGYVGNNWQRWEQVRRGYLLIAVGLLKKTVADLLAAPADALFQGARATSAASDAPSVRTPRDRGRRLSPG